MTGDRPIWIACECAAVAAAAALVVAVTCRRPPTPLDCVTAARAQPLSIALGICRAEYAATRAPRAGAKLATLLRRNRQPADATRLASELLDTSARADALYVLGRLADDDGRIRDAEAAYGEARARHLAAGAFVDAAQDDLGLTGPLRKEARYPEAFHALAECIAFTVGFDPVIEGHCHLAAVTIAATVGNFQLAQRELAHAEHLMRTDADHARFHFDRGSLYREMAREPLGERWYEQATAELSQALERATRAQRRELVDAAHLNLAFVYAERGYPALAQHHFASVDAAGRRDEDRVELERRQAHVELRRGDLAAAWQRNLAIYPRLTAPDHRMAVAVMQGRIALARGELAAAEHWARLGIDAVEAHRARVPLELRPWMLASRREPYELLFVIHARAGRATDALLAFDRWHDRTVKDAIAMSAPGRDGLLGAAELVAWQARSLAAPGGALADLARVDVLALVVAHDEAWGLTAQRGDVRVHDLGPAKDFRDDVDGLIGALVREPAVARPLASRLGAQILRDGIARRTTETLHVVIDATLADLPIAALRVDGRPLVAVRPIVRIDRVVPPACVPPRRPARAVVIADADGDLPYSRLAATALAAAQDVAPLVGASATSMALFATPADAALYVGVHGAAERFELVRMHDRDVTALEINARRLGPSLAFVAACHSSVALDREGAGSVASALHSAGARHVIATTRSVSDPGAADLTARFYRAGGVLDPPRALARAQAELADTDHRDWPFFVVSGHDVCQAP